MKILLKNRSCWVGTEQEEEIEVDDNTSDEDLDKIAWDEAIEAQGIEGWWEKKIYGDDINLLTLGGKNE